MAGRLRTTCSSASNTCTANVSRQLVITKKQKKMFGIHVEHIQGHRVQVAPNGVEGDPMPCLVWRDPNPKAMIRYCKVLGSDGKFMTALSDSELESMAIAAGLVVQQGDWYIP